MEHQILSNNKNSLLSRHELVLAISHTDKCTPSKKSIAHTISNIFRTKETNIVVKDIITRFGSNQSKCKVRIYEDSAVMARLEERKKPELNRRARKAAKKSKQKMFGTMKRYIKKEERKQSK